MILVSWNINGIRACYQKGLLDFINGYKPDVLTMQEIKATEDKIPLEIRSVEGYKTVWNPAKKPGYSGTGMLVKNNINVKFSTGIGEPKFDDEGRVITAEFDKFYLINAYFPNSQHGLTRLDFKIEFDEKLEEYANRLNKKKPVVITGDFNVAHKEIDLANPKQNEGNAGFTPEERQWMDHLLSSGWIDTFRMFNKEGDNYTWWTYRFKARDRNIGWRIDYFIVSHDIKDKVKKSWIMKDVMGSDHAPIALELDL